MKEVQTEGTADVRISDGDVVEIEDGEPVAFHRPSWFSEPYKRVRGRITGMGGKVANLLAKAARTDASEDEGDSAYLSLRNGAFQVRDDEQSPGRTYYTNEAVLGLHWGSSSIEFALSPRQVRKVMERLERIIHEAEDAAAVGRSVMYEERPSPGRGYDLADIRRRVDFAEVIAPHAELVRVGRHLVGLCPFHRHEGIPSFHVDPELGLWICYSCKAQGDVFRFVELIEHVDFGGAVERLARRLGIEPRSS